MAHFYGTVQGQRGPGASRLGSKDSGLRVTCNGWHAGITARAEQINGHKSSGVEDNYDLFVAAFTGGSGGGDTIGRVAYSLVDGNGELRPDAEFLRRIPATHWERLLKEDEQLGRTLRAMLFCNLDKVPA